MYNIYGDAVNTDEKMESHDEAGKIHCFGDFIMQLAISKGQLAKEESEKLLSLPIADCLLSIFPRGEIDIKGKGIMKTYFWRKNLEYYNY